MDQFIEFFSNHPFLFAALGAAILAFIANEVYGSLTGGKRVTVPEAVRLINDRDPLILDVRTPADFKRGHLLSAMSTPLAKLDEHLTRVGKDKSKPVLVYCALGNSSNTASERMTKQGYAEVYSLRGGINAWQSANLPVTTK